MNCLPIEVHENICKYLEGKDLLAYAEVFADIVNQLPNIKSRHTKLKRQRYEFSIKFDDFIKRFYALCEEAD